MVVRRRPFRSGKLQTMTLVRVLSVCACLCVAVNGAAAHGFWYYDAEAAMSCWNDVKVRQGLISAGLIGGHYKATESEGRVLVDALFFFQDGGKLSYCEYHAKDGGFPGPIELVRLYRRAKRR